MALRQKELFSAYGFSDKEMEAEKKRYEKVQKMIERKEAKKLDRAIRQFAGGKEDWLC